MKKTGFVILLFLSFLYAQADCTSGTIAAPVIDSVSVLPNGDVQVCWQPVLDSDLFQYNVWTIDATGANVLLASYPAGTNPLCHIYPAATNNANTSSVQIVVQAEMNCAAPLGQVQNPDLATGIGWVGTVYLQDQFQRCSSSIALNWTAYDDFVNPSVRYAVYANVNAGGFSLVGTTFSTNYNYLGVVPGNSYEFYVIAVENGGVGPFRSTSNTVNSDVTTALISPSFNYLNNVTVVDSQQIDIQFSVDTSADATGYKIQRAIKREGPFTTITTVNKVTGMDTIVDYSDSGLNTDSTSYHYRIELVNTECGFDSNYSNTASTILVNVTSSPVEAKNTITITEYKEWDLGVAKYDVYRALGGVWETLPIRSLPAFSDTTTIVDDVAEVYQGNGEFCYKVVAVGKGAVPAVESSSNDACAFHDPLLYVPNAFSPTGLYNPEFKPVLTFANPSSYTFRVFNRWGQVVFETGDVSNGWNGRFDNSGDLSPADVYFYVVEFDSAEGDSFTKRGTVTIVN